MKMVGYYTGNLATMDEKAYIRIVGRKKEMIIRGGYNIYSREIEEVFYIHPAVMTVAIVGLPDSMLREVSCACILFKQEMKVSTEELKECIKERIATYKSPDKLFSMEEFPMTSTGKIKKLYDQLHQAIKDYRAGDSLRCAIITGAGGDFSSGEDLKWSQAEREKHGEDWEPPYFPAYKEMQKCNKPIIAAVDGDCIASGFNLANLYCDFIIATERAKLGIPAVKRALRIHYPIPFPKNMSLGNALYMTMNGTMLTAEVALRMGVVSEVAPNGKLMDRVMDTFAFPTAYKYRMGG